MDQRSPAGFKTELEQLLNKYSMENASDTPDFILADYLEQCLAIFDATVAHREAWWGRAMHPPANAGESASEELDAPEGPTSS